MTLRHLVIGFRLVGDTRNQRKRVHKKGVELPQNWLDTATRPPSDGFGSVTSYKNALARKKEIT